MRSARSPRTSDRFVGVRLTSDEVDELDRKGVSLGSTNRSEAIRALVRGEARAATTGIELPPTIRAELDVLVEDGWAADLNGALTAVLTLGLQEFARTHTERLARLRQAARDGAERRKARSAADREGRGLLER